MKVGCLSVSVLGAGGMIAPVICSRAYIVALLDGVSPSKYHASRRGTHIGSAPNGANPGLHCGWESTQKSEPARLCLACFFTEHVFPLAAGVASGLPSGLSAGFIGPFAAQPQGL